MEQLLVNRLTMRSYFTNFVTEELYEAFVLHTVLFAQSYNIFAKLLAFLNIVNATRVQRYA